MNSESSSNFRRNLIQKEFRDLFLQRQNLPLRTDAVMVHSAPPSKEFSDIEKREKNPENVARIKYAIEISREISTGNPESLPLLLLNGDSEQVEPMKEVALSLGFPEDRIRLLDAGSRNVVNTKTQFDVVNESLDKNGIRNLVLVTSLYHVPRVRRTADKNLRDKIEFFVAGVPCEQFSFDVYQKIKGETKRILLYSSKGDISEVPNR